MIVRPLTETEGELFWEIRLEALKDSPQAFFSDYDSEAARTPADRLEEFRNRCKEPDNFIFGGFREAKLIALAGLHRDSNPKINHKAIIWGVYVTPAYRGQGVGANLMTEVIKAARVLPGLLQLELGVIAVEAASARRLYLAQGFEIYGREPRALKLNEQFIDEDLMVFNLDR